jgi:hypothetical protein
MSHSNVDSKITIYGEKKYLRKNECYIFSTKENLEKNSFYLDIFLSNINTMNFFFKNQTSQMPET